VDFYLSSMPSHLLARCIQLGLKEPEIEQAAKTSVFHRSDYMFSLGVYLLLQAKSLPAITEEEFIWLEDRVFSDAFRKSEDWPEYKDLAAVTSTEALELMQFHMARRAYFTACKLGAEHDELVSMVRVSRTVDLEAYAKLRIQKKLSVTEIHQLVETGVNLYYYLQLLEKKYQKERFESVMKLFSKDLFAFLLAVDDWNLSPEVVIERRKTPGGFDILKYNELRNSDGLDDKEAMQVLRP
jgi:hypothetical protein